jgi:ABC-2 type transport system ATP-binding protein
MATDDFAIKVDNVSKAFKLPHQKSGSIKNAIVGITKGKRGYENQVVLKDVSFEVKKGEFFGIVGRNGSGKSTLLKLLAGIYTPNEGSIQVNGHLTPFIELGVGFNPELTGRENVFLNGALLGFNRAEMQALYSSIVAFAELERFMDQKLKNYSSGMQVRLAFSIAIRANTDILVLDEVLAVGDAAFQQKCFDYFETLKREKKTIVLVTHDMSAVKRFCSRALLIEKGDIKIIGSPDEVADQYLFDNLNTEKTSEPIANESLKPQIKSLQVVARSPLKLKNDKNFEFDVEYELNQDLPVYLGFSVMHNGVSTLEHNSRSVNLPHSAGKKHVVHYSLPLIAFNTNAFKLNVTIFDAKNKQPLGYKVDATNFFVTSDDPTKGGAIFSQGKWSIGA